MGPNTESQHLLPVYVGTATKRARKSFGRPFSTFEMRRLSDATTPTPPFLSPRNFQITVLMRPVGAAG